MKNLYIAFVLLLLTNTVNNCFSQCSSCTYTVSSNSNSNYDVNNGQTLCISQGVTFSGNINLNGGTICNNGTINNSNVNLNSGKVYNYGTINKSSALSIQGEFHNYGKLNIGNNININSSGAFYNYNDAEISTTGHFNNGNIFHNYGDLTVGGSYHANNGSVNDNYGSISAGGKLECNATFLNEGVLEIGGDANVNNGGSLINGLNKQIKIDGAVFNNGSIINDGAIEIGGKLTNNGGAYLTNNNTITVLGDFFNGGIIGGDAVGCNSLSVFGSSIIQNGGANMSSIDFCANGITGNFTSNNGNVAPNVTFCSCTGGGVSPLPITLKSFTATCENDYVDIKWVTSSEINNAYFTILRSNDAVTWEPIQVMEGAGHSNSELTYSYLDSRIAGDIAYYRLKQTDYDGTEELFAPVSVQCSQSEKAISVFPNPADEQFTVSIKGNINKNGSIELLDFSGRIVAIYTFSGNDAGVTKNVDRNGLAAGTYLVRVVMGGELVDVQKLVLR